MIFHHPLPINEHATSASGIRPLNMLEAFKKLGYEVIAVTGYGKDRKQQIKILKKRIIDGEKFDFIYSESSTQPTLLTEKNHLPLYPFLDFSFFKFCKKQGIKIALFYRDIYWLFPDYGKDLSFIKKNIAKLFYLYDLYKYNALIDIVYLPSVKMKNYIPYIEKRKFSELPPGHKKDSISYTNIPEDKLELIYVGGIGSHYRLFELFKGLQGLQDVHCTICTRKEEWESVRSMYPDLDNVTVVYRSGKELEELYSGAHIALLYVEPQEYRSFAAPVKLYEYIGEGKAIIVSKKTLSGDFVNKYDIGWSIEYDANTFRELLQFLVDKPSMLVEKRKNIKKIFTHHNWKARAEQVVKDLF